MRRKRLLTFAVAVFGLFILLNIFVSVIWSSDKRSGASLCVINIQRIGAAISQYLNKEGGATFPESLDVLVREGFLPEDALRCPASGAPYRYTGPILLDAPTFLPLVWCKNTHNIKEREGDVLIARIPLFADIGTVFPYEPSYFAERLVSAGRYDEIVSMKGEDGKEALLKIVENEKDMYTKALAIWHLGTMREFGLSEVFASSLDSIYPPIQFEAARALANLGDRRAAKVLLPALRDSSYFKKRQTINALKSLTGGETFGYNPVLPDKAQEEALQKWQLWLDSLGK